MSAARCCARPLTSSDARRSLYARTDVETLAQHSRRPRARQMVAEAAIRWGDPVLVTAISEVRDGHLWLRGRSIEACADAMTLEETAAWLCTCGPIHCPILSGPFPGDTPFARAIGWLATHLELAPKTDLTQQAGWLMSGLTNACLGQDLGGPIHLRCANAWGVGVHDTDLLRRALVLLSDHELNPSTFAVRVCASTGASLPAALLAGMATLSGPRHGGAGRLADAALTAARSNQLAQFLDAQHPTTPYTFGFGHPLYPEGDPRAAHLLGHLPKGSKPRKAADLLSRRLGLAPNIDLALAALVQHIGAPREAVTAIFAIGRLAGWIAHAQEQSDSDAVIRPRARYDDDRAA